MGSARAAAAVCAALALAQAPAARAAPEGSPWGARYFPDVTLLTQDGAPVRFYSDLVEGRHVVVSFVFTRCKKQCGLITANLARVQRVLGDRIGKDISFLSISLDPERDTPAVMKAYAEAFRARPGWTFLTGRKEDVKALRAKFGDVGSIQDHSARIFIGNDAVGQWWITSALDNPQYLATVIGSWMDPRFDGRGGVPSYAAAPPVAPRDAGQALFASRCAMCHVAGGESVGPDLRGVVARRGRAWVARWLASPSRMVAAKDPTAAEVLAAGGGVLMPDPQLSEPELASVMGFLEGPERATAAAR